MPKLPGARYQLIKQKKIRTLRDASHRTLDNQYHSQLFPTHGKQSVHSCDTHAHPRGNCTQLQTVCLLLLAPLCKCSALHLSKPHPQSVQPNILLFQLVFIVSCSNVVDLVQTDFLFVTLQLDLLFQGMTGICLNMPSNKRATLH